MPPLKGLFFVQVLDDENGEESDDVCYGQVIESSDGWALVAHYDTRTNEPIDELTIASVSELSNHAKFYRTIEAARAQFVSMTRDHTVN